MNPNVYEYDDMLNNRRMVGFIAQEVAESFPGAVRSTVGFIPNVMKHVQCSDGCLLHFHSPDIGAGDVLKLVLANLSLLVGVSSIEFDGVRVLSDVFLPQNVFVVGKQVHDFKTVDHEFLSALVYSNVKDLSSRVSCLEDSLRRNKPIAQRASKKK
jgi:hypothetical protein